MRGVAGEENPAIAKAGHPQAGEGVYASPLQLVQHFMAERGAHHRVDAWLDVLRLLRLVRIRIPAELEVDPPHAVRLHVQQNALIAVEGRVEPKPAFGGKVDLHPHVSDEEAVAKDAPLTLVTEQDAQR